LIVAREQFGKAEWRGRTGVDRHEIAAQKEGQGVVEAGPKSIVAIGGIVHGVEAKTAVLIQYQGVRVESVWPGFCKRMKI
jgi:hypothetical protein